MASLPRVGNLTRERVSRELDDRGPDACRAEITQDLEANNPELLDIAVRCARDVGDFARIMTGFCSFYRALTLEARSALGPAADAQGALPLNLLPRVSPETRAGIVKQIDAAGSEAFTRATLSELERDNPELLIMWQNFAENQRDYAGVMQGFTLLYAALSAEAAQERGALH